MILTQERHYYEFAREERLLCAVLVSLLMQRGSNLATFVELINAKLVEYGTQIALTDLGQAEVYVEFAFLRDYWNGLGKDNTAKREFIFRLLSQVDSLAHHNSADYPSAIPDFNEIFMGARGKAIKTDVVYPGQWSVAAIAERFSDKEQFRDICRFKWAFNIKPDLVILVPGSRPLCVEAKLESREGWYPANDREAQIFDRRFGFQQGRVKQLELQEFMFGRLLGSPCQQVVIGRDSGGYQGMPFLSWAEVFQGLDKDGSVSFVRNLIERNVHMNKTGPGRP